MARLSIKKGDIFLCIKTVYMDDEKERPVYKEGETYPSEQDGCITDEEGYIPHFWQGIIVASDYFTKITD